MQTSSPPEVALRSTATSIRSPIDGDDDADGETQGRSHAPEGGSPGAHNSPSKRARLQGLGHKAKEKTKHLLHVNDAEALSGGEEISHTITDDPAFNPGRWCDRQEKSKRKSAVGAAASLGSVGKYITHPIDAIKGKATRVTAGKLSQVQRPFLSKDADLEFLEAHDHLDQAESSRASMQVTSDEEHDCLVEDHRNKVEGLKAQRESLRVAWTTMRFVTRVRVVPKRHYDLPKRQAFFKDQRKWAPHNWLKWMGHLLVWCTQDFSAQYIDEFDELPYDIDVLRRHVERIVFASAPWQAWAFDVRSVYRWEHPPTTLRWLALYVFLWYTDHTFGFLYAYILYIVLKSRFYPTSIDSLRTSMQRAHDQHQSAYRLGEHIDKLGNENWLEPLMQEMGPYIQLQLGDIANMLEVFVNFYNWMSPGKTAASLWFFASCLLVTLFCDMAFCVKITGFVAGGTFFLCWPIASLHPKYRYLVSPFKWTLWDIPTDAEWSFQYLRKRAQASREQIIKHKVEENHEHEIQDSRIGVYAGQTTPAPKVTIEVTHPEEADSDNEDAVSWHSAESSSSVLDSSDIIAFGARSNNHTGRLIIYANGVRFVRSLNKQELWRHSFLELAEMRKLEASVISRVTLKSLEQLELILTDGASTVLDAMKDRDEAFNTIIGFSALQWQVSMTHSLPGLRLGRDLADTYAQSLQYSPGEPGKGRGHQRSAT